MATAATMQKISPVCNNLADTKDHILLQLAATGDGMAFGELHKRHERHVFRVCHKITKDHEDAEECAQDTWVRVCKTWKQFQGRSNFSTWLYRVAFNVALGHLRKKNAKMRRGTSMVFLDAIKDTEHRLGATEESTSALQTIILKERQTALRSAISELSKEYAETIFLRYLEELTPTEIGRSLGKKRTTISPRLSRGRRLLHNILERSEFQELY